MDVDFRGKRWSEIDSDMLEEHYSALPLLTAEAIRYYLPAFMRGGIVDPESIFSEFTVYSLLPDGLRRRETCGFSEEQRRVIVEFARWTAWHPEAEQIEAYWGETEMA